MSWILSHFNVELIVCFVLVCMTICSILVLLIPQLSFIASHGKIAKVSSWTLKRYIGQPTDVMMIVSRWKVSKSLFKYMYIFGIATTSYHILSISLMYKNINVDIERIRLNNCINTLLLLEFHLFRRLLECFFCTIYGNSLMHISGLLCGLLHYFLVPLCIVHGNLNAQNSLNTDSTWTFLTMSIFFASNYFQLDCHLILYRMKLKFAESYALPKESLFEYVCCPHYLMEILIYFSFWMTSPNSLSLLCLLLWVVSNLSVVANQNLLFYKEKFKDCNQLKKLKRIFPLIW